MYFAVTSSLPQTALAKPSLPQLNQDHQKDAAHLMATKRFEEQALRVGRLIFRRHLAWAYLVFALFLGPMAVSLWEDSSRWQSIAYGLFAAASFAWAIYSGFRVRLRKLRCPCCDGEIGFRNLYYGTPHMVCKKCGQTSHMGLRVGGTAD